MKIQLSINDCEDKACLPGTILVNTLAADSCLAKNRLIVKQVFTFCFEKTIRLYPSSFLALPAVTTLLFCWARYG